MARSGLFDTPNEVMAVVADDLTFFRDHAVAALGTGVKELFRFIGILFPLDFFADVEERG
jgi:hypothetical protein